MSGMCFNREKYKHAHITSTLYLDLCMKHLPLLASKKALSEGPAMELFQNDFEREQHYADALSTSSYEIVNDTSVATEMEAALKEYDQVGADLGIIPRSCKFFADDPSWLTRWLTGEEKLQRI
ncbi:uncharacterized protein HKW66_Vig0077540 [Vigna angularis]|uniref:Uncharacterized protein n=1 Tax=Phaseolus angularis TaxID=3914 RepID=A0A8T0K5I4_PHAAN|nr:uncharacterized protein HKW66_Vig0077540 [Vigna angularis]